MTQVAFTVAMDEATRATGYQHLVAKVDAFFDRVQARVGAQMKCASGCSKCCQADLSVTVAEAEALADWWQQQSRSVQGAIVANVQRRLAATDNDACAALDSNGQCMVYEARPIVCRSHGVPIRLRDERSLPVVTACDLNFTDHGPSHVAADLILDQETLSRTLLAIHSGQSDRVGLSELLLDFAAQS